MSAGGYHHHMAMNTWNSAGAGPRLPALGLARVDIEVPAVDDLGALSERMHDFGIQTRDDGASVSFDDPWNNLIRVTTRSRLNYPPSRSSSSRMIGHAPSSELDSTTMSSPSSR